MAHLEHFLSVLLLCIVLLALNQAKPGGKGKGPRHAIPCEVYNGTDTVTVGGCPWKADCAGDETAVTYDGQEFTVTVCDLDTTEFDLPTFLAGCACQLEDSDGVALDVQTSCMGNDTCTGGPILFTNTINVSASFCQELNADFDFLELMGGGMEGGESMSDSSSSEER